MLRRLRFVKRLVRDLPQQLRLAYCLVRDPRVPLPTKAVFLAAMGVIVTPFIDLPEMIPVVGEIDVLALTLIALKVFIAACPPEVVTEQEQLIIEQRSRFDEDVQSGERLAIALWNKFVPGDRQAVADGEWSVDVESEAGAAGAAPQESGVVA